MENDDFYVGYHDKPPASVATFLRRMVIGVAVFALVLAAVLAGLQTPAEPGEFDFGHLQTFQGTFFKAPFPALRMTTPSGVTTNYVLVGEGKHRIPTALESHDGKLMSLKGTMVHRGSDLMIEVATDQSFENQETLSGKDSAPIVETLGLQELTGELVDTKCYFGVMRPAVGKVHRGCAVRCLSGGIPPGLLVRNGNESSTVYLLEDRDGSAVKLDPEWAGRNLHIRGIVEKRANLWSLRVESMSLLTP
jgi:hypothetical protein